jgi:hypothetical protein
MEIHLLQNSEFCTRKTDPLDEGTLCNEEDENDWQGDYKRCSHQVGPLHIDLPPVIYTRHKKRRGVELREEPNPPKAYPNPDPGLDERT